MPKGNGLMYNPKYNAPDNYTDMDGMTKTFTHINYSKKTKKSFHMIDGSSKEQHLKDREDLQEEILSLPPSLFPKEFQDFVVRGENKDIIEWNEKMIRDPGVPFTTLRNLKVLTENRKELYSQGLLF